MGILTHYLMNIQPHLFLRLYSRIGGKRDMNKVPHPACSNNYVRWVGIRNLPLDKFVHKCA